MSDRIAVFHAGRVEQVATPVDLYERPATAFVAGFVGTSNLLDGAVASTLLGEDDPGPVSIRPEKILLRPLDSAAGGGGAAGARGSGGPADPELCSARGVVREVVYVGSATHCVVDLDVGGALTVHQQNQEGSLEQALSSRGEPVQLQWRREHMVRLGGAVHPSSDGGLHTQETR